MFGSICGFWESFFSVWVPFCPYCSICSSSFLIFLLNIHLIIMVKT